LHGEGISLESAGECDLVEAVAERAVHQREHATTRAVAKRALHEAGGGRSRDVHRTGGAEEPPQRRLDARQQLFHPLAAMTDHRATLRGEDILPDLGRTGQEEATELSHGGASSGKGEVRCRSHGSNSAGKTSVRSGCREGMESTVSAPAITSGRAATPAKATK